MTGWLRNTFGADKANDAQVSATNTAANAATEAAKIQADSQREALDYLKEREALPMGIRDEALQGLAGFYQVPGQPKDQNALIQEAMNSPLYAAIMGTQGAGEQAILRNASATGGLRSGTTNGTLTDFGQQTANRALLESFDQAQRRDDYGRALNLTGLSGLAGLTGNDNAIANLMSAIGGTEGQGVLNAGNARAQGTIAQANTQTSALNNALQTILGVGQVAAGFYNPTTGSFSDIRLKTDIQYLGEHGGFPWYAWKWNDEAKDKLGLEGMSLGVLAHQVYNTHPHAIGEKDGYLTVDYSKLNLPEIH